MAGRAAKYTMGVPDDSKNTYRRDIVSANIWKRGDNSSQGRAHKLQGGQSWWKKKRQGYASTARSTGRGQSDSWTKTCTIPGPHGQALQLPG